MPSTPHTGEAAARSLSGRPVRHPVRAIAIDGLLLILAR
jgi:hypothetical protein